MTSPLFQRSRDLQTRGAQLIGIEALEEEAGLRLTFHFSLAGKCERLDYPVVDSSCPSLISLFGSADYLERLLCQRYGLKFIGNPNLEVGI